jgi:hypothetical protein
VLCAVELALEAGVPAKTHILNLVHRLIDGKDDKVARIDVPQALELRREHCGRPRIARAHPL